MPTEKRGTKKEREQQSSVGSAFNEWRDILNT
jgi:hypothetical protein